MALMRIEFFRHNISNKDIQNTTKALREIFLTTGRITKEFEEKFSRYLKVNYALGVTSCTGALHLSLTALGIGPEDEVITTPLSFVATAHAIEEAGAKPIFVDVESKTGNIDANLIERVVTQKTKAILPVHLYGQMVDMKKIRKIAQKHKLKIIEDAAHCIEGVREGVRPGQLSDAACFSFYATKNITCGEGGAIALNNATLASKLEKMRLHGLEQSAHERYEKKFSHPDVKILGWKYNMDNIQAAMLLHQLDSIEGFLKTKEAICRSYEEAFTKNSGIEFPIVLPGTKSGRYLFTIWVDPKSRETVRQKLRERGVPTALNYPPIHLMTFYQKKYGYKKGDFPIAEEIGARTITLPLYPKLKKQEVDYIIRSVNEVVVHH